MKKIIPIALLLLIFGCTSKKRSPLFNEIIKSEKGHFRGIELGAKIDAVRLLENPDFLLDDMPQYLHYDYEISMGNSYTVTYDFTEEVLYEIEIAVYFDVVDDAKKLTQEYIDYFDDKFGENKTDEDGFITWKTTSNFDKHNVEIAIKEDSEKCGYGCLTIIIRDMDF